jgi:hypothetical protein
MSQRSKTIGPILGVVRDGRLLLMDVIRCSKGRLLSGTGLWSNPELWPFGLSKLDQQSPRYRWTFGGIGEARSLRAMSAWRHICPGWADLAGVTDPTAILGTGLAVPVHPISCC